MNGPDIAKTLGRDAGGQRAWKPTRGAMLAGAAALALLGIAAIWTAALLWHTWWLWMAAGTTSAAAALHGLWVCRKLIHWRAMHWVGPYLREARVAAEEFKEVDVCFLFIDHFEPEWGNADEPEQVQRVLAWEKAYVGASRGHKDSDGRPPQHTWFTPVSQVCPAAMQVVARWPASFLGEIEYHLHHGPSATEESIRRRILEDTATLRTYGAIPMGRYGFVHGMYALAGGNPKFCRVVSELDLLRETGCYADFSFPAIGAPSQPSQVNSIFYASSNGRPKPHDRGSPAVVGQRGQGLMIIPGPMSFGPFLRVLDDAEVAPHYPPDPRRISRWLDAHVHVRGRPNWVFIAVHSHTAKPAIRNFLFAGPMQTLWSTLEKRFKRQRTRLHYVTAREAFNIIRAAEAGRDGNPADYRDFEISSPQAVRNPQRAS